jgi:hypothetical protein
MAEIAAIQNFGTVCLGLTLASEVEKMTPEATFRLNVFRSRLSGMMQLSHP